MKPSRRAERTVPRNLGEEREQVLQYTVILQALESCRSGAVKEEATG